MAELVHFFNGRFVSENELLISPRDLGFSRGYTVHDFIVTYNHTLFRLPQHIDRLFASIERIGLRVPWNKNQVIAWAQETIQKNNQDGEKTMRIYVTGGISNDMHQSDTPTILMIVNNRNRYPESMYEHGIKVKTVLYRRPYPEVKTNFYLEAIKHLSHTENSDIAELIYYDEHQVYEGAGSSLFVVIDNILVTAQSNVLDGTTRRLILDEITLPLSVQVRDFTIDELMNASELFLTGSNSEIRGVVELDGKKVGDGTVGPITKKIVHEYRQYITKETGYIF